MNRSPVVRFHATHNNRVLTDRRRLKGFIIELVRKEGRTLQTIDYIFCSDEKLLEINQQFLKHDYYTDIITFDLSETDNIVGEIYISLDRVKENAATHRTSFYSELHRVIMHGVLHLCGYKDKTADQKKLMRTKEDHYLAAYLK